MTGSAPSGGSILSQIATVNESSHKLDALYNQLRGIESELAKVGPLTQRYNDLKNNVDRKQLELDTLTERLKHADHNRLADEHDQLIEENNELQKDIQNAIDEEKEALKTAADAD